LVTKTLLMYAAGRGAEPMFYAVDKRTGEQLGSVEIPAPSNSTPMTYLHEGRQFIVIPIGSGTHPGSLVALALPE
jgi:quinoprotein glucose dehydrogenase